MKKTLAIVLVLALCLMSFVGCASSNVEEEKTPEQTESKEQATDEATKNDGKEEPVVEKKTMNIGTLKGPTGMGMAYLMEQDSLDKSEVDYNFNVFGAPDQLVGKIVKGEVDIAAVPGNMAAILSKKTNGNIQLLGVNTLGVLYIMENGETIKSLKDLEGKTIYSSGKGAAPEYILDYLLEANDIKNVTVEYKLEHSEIAAGLSAGDMKIAVLPQPFVTVAGMKSKDVRIAVDMTKEWEAVSDNSKLPMGAFIVRKDYAENNKEAIDSFLKEYKESIEFTNNNVDEAAELIAKYGILPKPQIAKAAIPNCNIVFMNSSEAKEHIMKFYEILKSSNPKTIGGELPGEEFFY